MLRLVESDNPPAHLLLGNDAMRLAGDQLVALNTEFETWKMVSAPTDFDQ